ncbi:MULTISPECIES: cytochrome C oxidase subunit IV family protein [Bordetella]|uniref:Cytochrome C oxidase subunit IV n=2 Tax=Bordetella TaxID=517 RepID=A0A261VH60_9BORD|nr:MULTISPECIES: cytochrome C oxidase subunit IV family protein [Bordetella]MDM9560543.1 cytochrome C oxidase subunit IV family protein [Bordetella petrii]OZI72493.1 hypothetical protein CAL24_19550 [Bordetella genomosp. 2]
MSEIKALLCFWLGLAVLSVATVRAAGLGWAAGAGAVVVALAVAKAWLIIDGFMELRHAPRAWRLLMLAWPVAMAAGLLLINVVAGR